MFIEGWINDLTAPNPEGRHSAHMSAGSTREAEMEELAALSQGTKVGLYFQ
jgi:hypothetical protein